MKIEKIYKNIISRIDKIEKKYPIMDFDIQEYITDYIAPIENILKYNIRNRINIPNYSYIDKDSLDREILEFLTGEELKLLISTIPIKHKK